MSTPVPDTENTFLQTAKFQILTLGLTVTERIWAMLKEMLQACADDSVEKTSDQFLVNSENIRIAGGGVGGWWCLNFVNKID